MHSYRIVASSSVTISAVGRTQRLDDREKFRSTGYKVACLDGRTETRKFRQSKRDGSAAENNTQQNCQTIVFTTWELSASSAILNIEN